MTWKLILKFFHVTEETKRELSVIWKELKTSQKIYFLLRHAKQQDFDPKPTKQLKNSFSSAGGKKLQFYADSAIKKINFKKFRNEHSIT